MAARLTEPLVMEPYFRPQIWGGRGLETVLGKKLPAEGKIGESWEISTQGLHVSRVAEGPQKGELLSDLWKNDRCELLGDDANPDAEFPLLIKYLDCHELLSIQVHPSDEVAQRMLGEQYGKTEAWVVLGAEPSARVYAGLKVGTTRGDLERHLDEGTVANCLHSFTPKPGDCVFLKAGTVHAVGGGVVMAEVQQTSDATFRLFDWNRLGADGKPRELHREKSLESIDWSAGPVNPLEPLPIQNLPDGVQGSRLAECNYFRLSRYELAAAPYAVADYARMSIWMVLNGVVSLGTAAGWKREFRQGETVLVPAAARGLIWTPVAATTLLHAAIPPADVSAITA